MKVKDKKIITITKEAFNKLSNAEQRIAVANDVLARIKVGQLNPKLNRFCRFVEDPIYSEQLSVKLESIDTKCEVCAKGGLFLSYIGIVNNFTMSKMSEGTGESNDSLQMKVLSKVFGKKQLSMIETAFEGQYYDWNTRLSDTTKDKCIAFYNKHKEEDKDEDYDSPVNKKGLVAICKNIIKNQGTFNP